mmetsp:Transcript_8461/g.9841  ORF Transcript_8461/g.9841 Transcript_8461/m.9841 type:complete len:241 (+) Transcript_8461:371-1093(+)|eukprot:CAMPEP_0197848606 /NCGR_PEP_ID=MMETSP1438-20131217/9315_1 /TAXON_ID=1461541 /ORGANISM="Pterosperma sp., Strain CCMP1384" /LENGTH=240 /DNA_ID=CAMNT_0043460941 /DNA_START=366 /DNA_END=1088 /DNA_ORIENTATION=+
MSSVSKLVRFADIFRKSNASLVDPVHCNYKGTILQANKNSRFAIVDLGLKEPVKVLKDELEREGSIRVGEELDVTVETIWNPIDEMEIGVNQLIDDRRGVALNYHLHTAYEKNEKVKGRVLNTVNGGYAVGIAGKVVFLPKMRASLGNIKIGELQDFNIISVPTEIEGSTYMVAMPERAGPTRGGGPVGSSKPSGAASWTDFVAKVRARTKPKSIFDNIDDENNAPPAGKSNAAPEKSDE